jgi:DNA-binding response OmpR family regulator
MSTILLVDDDHDLVDLLTFAMHRAGFIVLAAHDGPTATKHLVEGGPDLAVLDINMGAWNGFDMLKNIRRRSQIPVIVLTARDAEEDKVRGLDLGADDYLTKPFSHRELLARMRAHLRRHGQEWSSPVPKERLLQAGPLTLNVAEHSATKDGQPLDLTVTEFRLLHYLMVNAGTVVPTRAILKHVWGFDESGNRDVVRVTVHRLRRKMEDDVNTPRFLQTVPGVGVMLKPD